jgi:O-antigen/teichoic acid export membrane protein
VTRALLLLSLAVQVAVSFGAPILAAVFLPASYGGSAALVIVWVAASAVPATVVSVQIVGLFDASRTRSLAVVTPVAVAIGVGLAVPLSEAAGPAGAGACYPLTFGLVALGLAAVTRRLDLPAPAVRAIVRAGAVSAVVAVTAAAAQHAGLAMPARLAAGAVALGLAVAVLGRGIVRHPEAVLAAPAEVVP